MPTDNAINGTKHPIKIKLRDASIYKADERYISLTNLVVDNNGNIDTLEEEIKKTEVENLDVVEGDIDTSGGGGTAGGSSSGLIPRSPSMFLTLRLFCMCSAVMALSP